MYYLGYRGNLVKSVCVYILMCMRMGMGKKEKERKKEGKLPFTCEREKMVKET
jgi:hypothetical protein